MIGRALRWLGDYLADLARLLDRDPATGEHPLDHVDDPERDR